MQETMTISEKLDIMTKAFELRDAGDEEGFDRTFKLAPMPAYLAKAAKESIGADFLIDGGWKFHKLLSDGGAYGLR